MIPKRRAALIAVASVVEVRTVVVKTVIRRRMMNNAAAQGEIQRITEVVVMVVTRTTRQTMVMEMIGRDVADVVTIMADVRAAVTRVRMTRQLLVTTAHAATVTSIT